MSSPENTNNLVIDLAAHASRLAQRVETEFAPLVKARGELRRELLASSSIHVVPSSPDALPKSMCAVDGARVQEKLYAADLLATIATLANAQSTPDKPTLPALTWAELMQHTDGTDRVAQTAMGSDEVTLLQRAPHEVRIMDGSFITPLVMMREGLFHRSPVIRDASAKILLDRDMPATLGALIDSAENNLIAVAKSDSSSVFAEDFAERFGIRFPVKDRLLATQILEPGEMLTPRTLRELSHQTVDETKGSKSVAQVAEGLKKEYERIAELASAGRIMTTYYKPVIPGMQGANSKNVIRFEFYVPFGQTSEAAEIARQHAATLNTDMAPPFMLEPFCQHAVDRNAKQISSGVEALKSKMIRELSSEDADTYRSLLLQGYRT